LFLIGFHIELSSLLRFEMYSVKDAFFISCSAVDQVWSGPVSSVMHFRLLSFLQMMAEVSLVFNPYPANVEKMVSS
jgi:hypothetical protein